MTYYLLFLLQILFAPGLLLVPYSYLWSKERRLTRSLAQSNRIPPKSIRIVEVSILLVITAMPVLHIASGGIGMANPPLPTALYLERGIICAVLIALAYQWGLVGLYRRVALASAGMLFSILCGFLFLSSANLLSYERFEQQIREIPLPVEIRLNEPVDNVDVIVNGVKLGKAPLHTTMEEILAKAPVPIDESPDNHQQWKNLGGDTYMPVKKITVDLANDIHSGFGDRKSTSLFMQFERFGQPLLVSGNISFSNGSRKFGNIQPARIPFSVMTETWNQEISLLLQKAELADFHVSSEWIATAETYGDLLWKRLLASVATEPRFQNVLNDWARSRYQLDQIIDPKSAWKVFETIQAEANRTGSYRTYSLAGDAVDQLIGQLDSAQLVAKAQTRLRHFWNSRQTDTGWGWGVINKQPYFTSYERSGATSLVPADFVLAHAIWKLDQRDDAESELLDNPVESAIVPELLRLSYRDPKIRVLAAELGGTVIAQFERRRSDDGRGWSPDNDLRLNEYVEGQFVRRSFWEGLNSPTPSGAAFRQQHSSQALELAESLLQKSYSLTRLPTWTNFLFLDVKGREPLARDFWKRFSARLETEESTREWAVAVRWSYLARTRPLPSATEFAGCLPKTLNSSTMMVNPDQSLMTLPPDAQAEIMRQSLAALATIVPATDTNPEALAARNQIAFQLKRILFTIPSPIAADLTMDELRAGNPGAREIGGAIQTAAEFSNLTNPLTSRLATSPDPLQRKWVLPQIRRHPDQFHRDLLASLLNDDDESVRKSAEDISKEIRDLENVPLPKLK